MKFTSKTPFKYSILLMSGLLAPVAGFAQAQAAAAATAAPNTGIPVMDILNYLLLLIALVLAVGIWYLGSSLLNLSKDQMKKSPMIKSVILALVVSSALFSAIPAHAAEAASAAPQAALNWTPNITAYVLCGVIAIETIALVFLAAAISNMTREVSPDDASAPAVQRTFSDFFERFNDSVAVEREADILLDHNYDGIQELDNDLPPWWKYGFYISVLLGFFYLLHFHVLGTGDLQLAEYEKQMQQGKEQVDAYRRLSATNVDENDVKLADASGISEGRQIFAQNCAACHGDAGEGNVGPNLTDDYWIHGGTLNEMFHSVKYGWPEKGMRAWSTDLSPVQIQQVVSFIHSINGTNPPNAKAPQGTKAGEPAAAGLPADSSAMVSSDTTPK